jgi:hypothetical protein
MVVVLSRGMKKAEQKIPVFWAETVCSRSGSDFQNVSAPATALELPVITDFIFKSTFSCFL